MAKGQHLSAYQQKIVGRYYENIDTISLQKLSEAVGELYLCTDEKKAARLWTTVEGALMVALIERLVDEYWQDLALSDTDLATVRREVANHIDQMIPKQDQAVREAVKRVNILKHERDALLRAHYAGARPEVDALLQIGLAPNPGAVDRTELAAWTQVCRVALNLHESITRY